MASTDLLEFGLDEYLIESMALVNTCFILVVFCRVYLKLDYDFPKKNIFNINAIKYKKTMNIYSP